MTDPRPGKASGPPDGESLTPFWRAVQTRDLSAIGRMRHSLRTPLNQIIGYSEMLLENRPDQQDTQINQDLRRIHVAAGHLLAVVNEGLAAWKIEAGVVDLNALLVEMRAPLNSVIGYAELCLDTTEAKENTELSADLSRIRQAAENLHQLFLSPNLGERGGKAGGSTYSSPGFGRPSSLGDYFQPPPTAATGKLLVVDDESGSRDMLSRRLQKLGYEVAQAANGREAIDRLRKDPAELVLLDLVMPELDGLQTLQIMRSEPALRDIPVIMITALDEVESTVRCIEVGAVDFVPKPFNPVVLRARISAALERQRLHAREKLHAEQISRERAKSDRLLLNVLPHAIADRLKQGESTIVDSFPAATVLFADIVGFSSFSASHTPARTVQLLNDLFSAFDRIAEHLLLEKIKTIGDAYMLVGGVPVAREDHAAACATAALEMREALRVFNRRYALEWEIRIGLNSGPVVAGIIGTRKFSYDLWGDTVNVASRMESHGQPGKIQISERTRAQLGPEFTLVPFGKIPLKNVGEMQTYFLEGKS
jgi:class 3 adenylate cyclase/CheY-like chemotaxis protein